jgi:alpha-tubulin suppressor-like RCC1 family protein
MESDMRRPAPTVGLWLVTALVTGISCRSDDVAGPTPPRTPSALAATTATLPFTLVRAGLFHSCGLVSGGKAYCWGSNDNGQLGDGSTDNHALPTLVAGGLLFRALSAGYQHTCGLTSDGRAYCWGDNTYGALGDGTSVSSRLSPVPVAGGRRFRQISVGTYHSCALTTAATNKIYCWGTGFLGNGAGNSRYQSPQLVTGTRTYRSVDAGVNHTCAVSTTYKAFCWGYNFYGQLGNGASTEFVAKDPVAVAGLLQFRTISAGQYHTCAVTTANKAYCWGFGEYGQIGEGQTRLRFKPRAVLGGLSFDRVTAGAHYNCGETIGNRTYCWGDNFSGQLGDGTQITRLTPTAVRGGLFFQQVAAGGFHTCAFDASSQAWCWGYNYYGQLGNGTSGNTYLKPYPVQY